MTTASRSVSIVLLAGMVCVGAWAGNVSVTVKDGGAAVSGALVRIEPGGTNGTTNAAGKWTAPGIAAGDYRVIAWKTVGGALRGAIANVAVPAGGNLPVALALTDAVWTYDYFPYSVGNWWQYNHRRVSAGSTEVSSWREVADRATTVAGDPAVVLQAIVDGALEWEETRASTRAGFTLYTTQRGTDTITFDPPITLGPLLPRGYEWVVNATGHHSDGSPDSTMELRVTFTGLEDTTVPAGTFAKAARLDSVQTLGGAANNLRIWCARNVGIVRQVESNAERTNTKVLEEYHISALPMRLIRPPLRPVLPR